MPQIARIIGGAGTGKTTFLLDKMEKALEAGEYSPFDVGFVSFTRAARHEAAQRAGTQFGIDPADLQRDGWFRTLHSICFTQLGIGKGVLLSDCRADRKWLQEWLQEDVSRIGEDGEEGTPFEGRTDAERVLSMWDAARNRLVPFQQVHERAQICDDRTPELSDCRRMVEQYEHAKQIDHRLDFTDMLGRFAGWRFLFDGPQPTKPSGAVPDVPVWFFDEQQDTSALLDDVCKRLIGESRWVYLCGDPFQSIYGWAGADPQHFMSWAVQKEQILDQTFRCPQPIHDLGENILRRCSNYWDRGIKAAEHSGKHEELGKESAWPEMIDPRESWLLLARTNHVANRLATRLDAVGYPWVPTSARGGTWAAPVRKKAARAMIALQSGHPITAAEWKAVLKQLEQKGLFERGTKKRWEEYNGDPNALNDLDHIQTWGATPRFREFVRSGRWKNHITNGEAIARAQKNWGIEVVDQPRIQVGTIHSVKGGEADNVLLTTTTSHQVHNAMSFSDGCDEEYRVGYVGVTRARHNLFILNQDAKYRMEFLDSDELMK